MTIARKDKKEHDPLLCAALNKATADGRHMEHYSDLLQEAINCIVSLKSATLHGKEILPPKEEIY